MAWQRGRERRSAATAAMMCVLFGATALSAATPEGRAAAKQHLARAEELKKQGKLADACAELAEVERLDPKLPTLIELAECTESAGKLVEAEALWAAARDRAKKDEKPQSRARAESRLAAVQRRVARLTLQLAPNAAPGAQVLLDDVALEAASLAGALPLNPGEHVVVVKLAGRDDAKYPVTLGEGEERSLPIAVGPASAGKAAAPAAASAPATPLPAPALPTNVTVETSAPAAPPAAPVGWWTGPHKAGVVSGLVGLAAIGGGSALCVTASADSGSRVDSSVTLGGVSIVTGSVLLVSGLVLLATSRDEAPQQARLRVAPSLEVARTGRASGAIADSVLVGAAGEF
ncbi:MAG TPA: hypothetical protein VHP33_08390 [Polyangiaceae bacterium]|nr:hypothetical protein [Polyangiaceae bacterium]